MKKEYMMPAMEVVKIQQQGQILAGSIDANGMNTDLQKLRDRMIIVEQSSKSAHHRIDKLEGKE